MATVTVLNFPHAQGADEALAALTRLQQDHLLPLRDAALVTWPSGTHTPRTRSLPGVATTNGLGGIFWGTLFGQVFFNPLLGLGTGLHTRPAGGAFREHGIDDQFLARLRGSLKEGTSALFLVTEDGGIQRLVGAMTGLPYEIIATGLSREQERRLREAFLH